MPARLIALVASLVLSAGGASLVGAAPAHAQGRVGVANEQGSAAVDPRYATTLRVKGTGFQSVRGGHGGMYVFFGTVSGKWRPSQGGVSGTNYLYVPDSRDRNNAGYQSFVAFPGANTSEEAAATMGADGSWSVSITVPGATFQAVGAGGRTRTVDCRKVTCGVITIGAHGVRNVNNETFTPVAVRDLYSEDGPAAQDNTPAAPDSVTPSGGQPSAAPAGPPGKAAAPEKLALEVDRGSAKAGHALSFAGRGLPPGAQASAILDDGVAAAGPFVIGSDGRVTGVLSLPADIAAGTHELRLFGTGLEDDPTVRFAVTATAGRAAIETTSAAGDADADKAATTDKVGIAFFVVAALALAAAAFRTLRTRRRAARA